MTTAKALGGGLPVGACVTSLETADVLERGDHGSTFAGGPLVAAASLAAFEVLDDPELLRRVRDLGGKLRDGLGRIDGDLGGPWPGPHARRQAGRRRCEGGRG